MNVANKFVKYVKEAFSAKIWLFSGNIEVAGVNKGLRYFNP